MSAYSPLMLVQRREWALTDLFSPSVRSKLAQATGSLISSVKDACRAGLLDWSPRIMLAMYTCDIQTSSAFSFSPRSPPH